MSWVNDLRRILDGEACVLVTLNQLIGSAPRESGCRMVVTPEGIAGSIGGGNLEFTATGKARELLAGQAAGHQAQEAFGLGPALNQCCGGAVTLLYEVYGPGAPAWLDALLSAQESGEPVVLASRVDGAAACKRVITAGIATDDSLPGEVAKAARDLFHTRPGSGTKEHIITIESQGQTWWLEPPADDLRHVMLFGAGHVGQAVVRTLSPLPFRVTWIDGREGLFPPGLPAAFATVHSDDPPAEVATAEAGSIFVVMTHSHQLDEEICLQILQRDDFAWLGLIGSETKRRRFVLRLGQRGIEPAHLERLVCPIGLSGIGGKEPATIAFSLVALVSAA
ncbi:MAG: xanthine dehydrogenase accessory protein XdhC [Proteobacteria bacterium]|nr:xanthine dehydrogenase accessory protein XdhC [Pseudomonadota bacterium]